MVGWGYCVEICKYANCLPSLVIKLLNICLGLLLLLLFRVNLRDESEWEWIKEIGVLIAEMALDREKKFS